jgi:hypothetical protein
MTTLEKARETVILATKKDQYDNMIDRMDNGITLDIFLDGVNRTKDLKDGYPEQSWTDLNLALKNEFQAKADALEAQIDAIWA